MEQNIINNILNDKQSTVDKYKDMVIHQQDVIIKSKWYEYTIYYNNYINCILELDSFCLNAIAFIKNKYIINNVAFKNPFYIEKLCLKYENLLNIYNDIIDTAIKVNINSLEYFYDGKHIIKKVDGCYLEVELVPDKKKVKLK